MSVVTSFHQDGRFMEWEQFTVTMRRRRLSFELRLGITESGYSAIIHSPASPVPVVLDGTRDTTALQWFADMLAVIEQAASRGD